jgi:hypothetical protein
MASHRIQKAFLMRTSVKSSHHNLPDTVLP